MARRARTGARSARRSTTCSRQAKSHTGTEFDAVEIWHFYAGEPLELSIAEDGRVRRHILGPSLSVGARPQLVVPKDAWQMARPLGQWVLVGCTVTPGYEPSSFELAPEGWSPVGR